MRLIIRQYGDPALRAKGRRIDKIDDRVRALAADMLETMHAANGVGLAAQQIGEALQLTVIDVAQVEDRPSTLRIDDRERDVKEAMPLVLINPEITLGRAIVSGVEGCLSFPEISADIDRSEEVHRSRADFGWVHRRNRGDRPPRTSVTARNRSSQRHSLYRPHEFRPESLALEQAEAIAEGNAARSGARNDCAVDSERLIVDADGAKHEVIVLR